MLFSDSYKELKSAAQASLRERGSKFLAYAYPVKSEEEVKKYLNNLRSEFPDATHHCYAYILHPDKSAQKSSDDGEPSNSAGKPILRAILSMDLTNTLVIVVRYFGGTMLGIPGLIQAYGDAAKLALEQAEIEDKFMESEFILSAYFEFENEIYYLVNKLNLRIVSQEYQDKAIIRIAVRRRQESVFLEMAEKNHHLKVEQI